MKGFENYQIADWQEYGLVKKVENVISTNLQHFKKNIKKSQRLMTAIGLGLASTYATSYIDINHNFKANKTIALIEKSDFPINEQLSLSFNNLKNNQNQLLNPTRFSLSVLSWLKSAFPNIQGVASIGLDYDGEIYIKLTTQYKIAYLSLEQPNLMHLLVKNIFNDEKIRLDNIEFKKGSLPRVIKNELNSL